MRKILFTLDAFDLYNELQIENKQAFKKLKKLIAETKKTPFDGNGKPGGAKI